ncbi:MAG: septum formation initiator family protein [Actinobacteria bacterium]|nr:septum formation initiator family protein [Actinomycetota bacterium]MCL6095057.1 septum formation initiator family protein [Actinomycetota bacterium]
MTKAPSSRSRLEPRSKVSSTAPRLPVKPTGRSSSAGRARTDRSPAYLKNGHIVSSGTSPRRARTGKPSASPSPNSGHQGRRITQMDKSTREGKARDRYSKGGRAHGAGIRHAWVTFGIACCVALVILVVSFPFHSLIEQHTDIARYANEVKLLDQQEQALNSEVKNLQSPGYIAELAHRDYGLIKPGEKEYFVAPLPGTSGPNTAVPHQLDGTMPPGSAASKASVNSTDSAKATTKLSLWARVLRRLEFWKSS